MLEKYKKAMSQENSTIVTENLLTVEFWEEYETKLKLVSSDEEKNKQKYNNLRETVFYLFKDERIEITNHNATCTKWMNENTLYFNPSLITTLNIEEEQQESFKAMHESGHPINIDVYIDLKNLTFTHMMKLTFKASLSDIKHGLRLWSTLPHKISNVFIKKPESSKKFFELIFPSVLHLVPPKIRKRIKILNI